MKCLLLEDDIELNETICEILTLSNHEVVSFCDGDLALKYIEKEFFDIYILDINVPNTDGLELLQYIKSKSNSSKVLMISSNDDIQTIQKSYELGCCDYMKKPFYIEELRFKIENIQKEFFNQIVFSMDTFFETSTQQLIAKNEVVKLTKKELALLNLLIKNPNKIVSKDDIIEYIFDNQYTNDVNIRAIVKRVRQKLPKGKIVTLSGVGYRLQL